MLMTRRNASFASSFDDESQTIEATVSTFADVPRRDARGAYIERLDPAGLDVSDPTKGIPSIPLLDSHRQGTARDVIGIVQALRNENGRVVATIRLSQAADAQPVIARIREGTLRGVSIGYAVERWEETKENGQRVRTARVWHIVEVSAVPVPADNGANFRGFQMENENELNANDNERVQTRAAIRQIARSANLSAEWADTQIDAEATVVEARAAAFEAMQSRSQQTPRIRVVGASGDDPTIIRQRRADALFARISGTQPEEPAREYVGDSMRDHARSILEANGISTRGMNADAIFTRAHTISDFQNLLSSTGNRFLMSAYETAQSPLKRLARQGTIADFRAKSLLKLSDIGTLKKVSESGEIKHTSRSEAAEGYKLDTYASIFGLSRQALINDDLGAFADWGRAAGRAAAETEAQLLVDLLISNPKMGEDSKKLFHADHGNLDTTALSDATIVDDLSAARLALRTMKGVDGKTIVNGVPKFLVVPAVLETAAEQWLKSIYPATMADANPFEGKLEIAVEPRLTDVDSFYIFADPASLPVLEYAYLSGAPGPQISSREGWDTLGMEYRVVLDFGCGAVDFRGAWAKVPA